MNRSRNKTPREKKKRQKEKGKKEEVESGDKQYYSI